MVIPCVGPSYVEEALLSASFAVQYADDVREVVVVTDQPREAFGELPEGVRVVVKELNADEMPAPWTQLWKSRLLKLAAPLEARGEGVAMIDSDVNLLRPLALEVSEGALFGAFRNGRMEAKIRRDAVRRSFLRGVLKPFAPRHLNSGVLAATRETWARLCPLWREVFERLWRARALDQPPTDQLPLAIVMDRLGLKSVDIGTCYNWPVSKEIGGREVAIPSEVIGAHGGFPLSEWARYRENSQARLHFHGVQVTRKVRYAGGQGLPAPAPPSRGEAP